jgi:solute carrier family 10 (sodium/bile acid cotransporter), member 7
MADLHKSPGPDLEKQAKVSIDMSPLDQEKQLSKQNSEQNSEQNSLQTPEINPQETQPKKKKPLWRRILNLALDQWFLLTLAFLILIASQVQVPKDQQKIKSTVVSYLCVSVIFFFTGCTLKTQTLIDNYARWKLHLFVQIQCFLLTSLLMYGLVSAAASNPNFMDPGLLVGMILTGCVATTISSNVVMTGEAHGNQALTVVQSTIGNALGPFLTPLLFKAYTSNGAWYTAVLPQEPGGYAELYKRVFKQLGLSVFLPMIVGQLVQHFWPAKTKLYCSTYKLGKLGSVSLLIIIWQTYDSAFSSSALQSMRTSNAVFLVCMSTAFFLTFLALSLLFCKLARFERADTVAVCYCVPAKTPAMGVPMSTVLFVGMSPFIEAQLQLPLVIYQGLQIMAGTILTVPFRKWVDSEKRD